MAIKNDREYRNLGSFEIRAEEGEQGDEQRYVVEGYASTFDTYELLEYDGVRYLERIEPTAFEHTDMSDVVFLRDHAGRVMARTKNGTVQLTVDTHGLHTRTDLRLTEASREMFEDISVGNYSQMSFAFIVDEDEYVYNEKEKTDTRIIKSIRKLFDISAVAFPANPATDIGVSARALFDGEIERIKAERLEAERRAREIEKLKLKIKLSGGNNGN